ncbi:hypothetical protein ACKWTF_005266 [Chironomus riparius]
MGHLPSKLTKKNAKPKIKKKGKVKKSPSFNNKAPNFSPINAFSFENNDDIDARRKMQDQLAFDSDIFVLNQMMMCVQFFGNFERDLWEAIELNSRKENQKTKCLTKHCKTVMLPDRLAEAIDRRVKYVEKHGKMKNQLQPLHTQALYIIHDNIEILNPGDTTMYAIADDAPIYKFQIENPYESARRKKVIHHAGYIKLKSSDKITKNDFVIYNSSSDSQYVSGSIKNETEDDGTYGDNEEDEFDEDQKLENVKMRNSLNYARNVNNIFEQKMGYYTASMNSITPSSSEYDYTYIKALNTPKPLNIVYEDESTIKPLSTVMLPDSCVTTVSRFMIHSRQQDQFYRNSTEDEDIHSSDEKLQHDRKTDASEHPKESFYYEDKQYLNSRGFLTHFIHLFRQTLANELGISEEVLKNATWKGSSVYCDPWEIIPAISSPWPREANEWIYRRREIRIDPITNLPYQWPSLEMIEKITNFGCYVIPQGFAPKVGSNPQRELEWKIVFPEAEKFLESRLTFAQIKIYMITKALIKAFIEPGIERGVNMFTAEHIRSHLFWQCEHNYTAWSEDLLGEGLLKFLSSLLQCIKTHRLPDYFIPKRNLLETIPEKILVDLHKKIYRIIENPVPYVLIAIRNLRYQRNFYPKLKCKRLYSRLLIDDPSKMLYPSQEMTINDYVPDQHSEEDENDGISLATIPYFDQKERKSRKKRTRCVRFVLDDKYVAAYSKKKEIEEKGRKVSIESIDTKVVFLKHMEILRRKLIYKLFIEQFIDMTKLSLTKYQAYQQAMSQLNQAERLCYLLADDKFYQDAQVYMETIETLRDSIQKLKMENLHGPELPRRKSLANEITIGNEPIYEDQIDTNNNSEGIPSDDDNDEIYSYHKSVVAQIHATTSENLARFQHTDECDDEIEGVTRTVERLNLSRSNENVDDVTAL